MSLKPACPSSGFASVTSLCAPLIADASKATYSEPAGTAFVRFSARTRPNSASSGAYTAAN
jgi:hypothetical protein